MRRLAGELVELGRDMAEAARWVYADWQRRRAVARDDADRRWHERRYWWEG